MSYTDKKTVTYDSSWSSLSLVNGWASYSSIDPSYGDPKYRRINGIVEVQGLIRAGSGLIAYLPSGFRPTVNVIFSTTTFPNAYGRFDIGGGGDIIPISYDSGWLSICCSFYAEQ